jgi:hypothetical protein
MASDLLRDECWVLNTRGRSDTFYPFDLRQELNNLAIKVGICTVYLTFV